MTQTFTQRATPVLALGLALTGLMGCAPDSNIRLDERHPDTQIVECNRMVNLETLQQRLKVLEEKYSARIGISALDTCDDVVVGVNEDTRFGFASSIKALLAAFFLEQVKGDARDEVVTWTAEDVAAAGHAPVTGAHIESGLTLQQLAEATVRSSDNLAFNLVLQKLGGPAAFQEWLRGQGDSTTEIAAYEPELNNVETGKTANTSTPAAINSTLAQVVTSVGRTGDDQDLLVEWMSNNATGDRLIRAGIPDGWTVADKSGGAGGIRNDIAVAVEGDGDGDPVIVSILTTKHDPDAPYEDDLVAEVAGALFVK